MAKETVKKTGAKTKKPNLYRNYMKTELGRVKKNDPKLTHKEAFKLVAKNWATASDNPKNKVENK